MATRPARTVADGVDLSQHVADVHKMAAATIPGGGKVRFVVRYTTPDTVNNPGKQLKPPELAAIRAAGLAVCVVSETTAGRASAGYSAGRVDARIASNYCKSLGMPTDMPIHWAADKDFTGTTIDAYARGWKDEIGVHRCGVYGGIDVIKWCFDHGLVSYGWQTFAWSEGHIDPRATAYQWMNSQSFAGNEVDFDAALTHDYGQWEPGTSSGDTGVDMALTDADAKVIWDHLIQNNVLGADGKPIGLTPARVFITSLNSQMDDTHDKVLDLVAEVDAVTAADATEAGALAGLPAAVAAAVAALPGAGTGGTLTEAEIEQAVADVLARTNLTVMPPTS